jgi:hypothetical protein
MFLNAKNKWSVIDKKLQYSNKFQCQQAQVVIIACVCNLLNINCLFCCFKRSWRLIRLLCYFVYMFCRCFGVKLHVPLYFIKSIYYSSKCSYLELDPDETDALFKLMILLHKSQLNENESRVASFCICFVILENLKNNITTVLTESCEI